MADISGESRPGGLGGVRLSNQDDRWYTTHVEVANGLFGKQYKGHQRAMFKIDDDMIVWFPKLYANGDWDNRLSEDGNVLTMRHVPGGKYGGVEARPFHQRLITFGHIKPSSGRKLYRFLGVFEAVPDLSDSTKRVHQLVSDTVDIDDHFRVSFAPKSPTYRPPEDAPQPGA